MTLDKGKPGEKYAVKAMDLPEQVEHRLEALGMTVDTRVLVLENKRRGIMVVKVRGTRLGKIEVM